MRWAGWILLLPALALAGCASSPFQRSAGAAGPDSLQALAALQQGAAAAYARGDAAQALPLYRRLAQRAPDDVQAWRRLGNLELLDGRDSAALYAYGHAVQLGGGTATVWHNLAMIRVRQAQTALQRVQAQPVSAADAAIRADSVRAARALAGVFPGESPAPPAAAGPAATGGP